MLFVSKRKYENLKGYYDLSKVELEETRMNLDSSKKAGEVLSKVNVELANEINNLKSLYEKEKDTSSMAVKTLESRNEDLEELKGKYRSAYSTAGSRLRKIKKLVSDNDALKEENKSLLKQIEELKSNRYLKVELPPQKAKKMSKMKIKSGVRNSQANKLLKQISEERADEKCQEKAN